MNWTNQMLLWWGIPYIVIALIYGALGYHEDRKFASAKWWPHKVKYTSGMKWRPGTIVGVLVVAAIWPIGVVLLIKQEM